MAIFGFIIQLVDISYRISIINDVSSNLAEVSNINSNGKELCLKFHNVMMSITITKRETISEILQFQSDELIDKTEIMVINFYEELITLYDKDNLRFKVIVLGSFHMEQLEKLLNK